MTVTAAFGVDPVDRGAPRGGSRPFRLLAYTDALEFAGAERGLATILGALGPHVEVGVLGIERTVAEAIAAARPGAEAHVVSPVRNKLDVAAIREHVRVVRELRPDVVQVNLRTSWSCQYGSLAAVRHGTARVISFEHAPMDGATGLQLWLKRRLGNRLDAQVAATAFSAGRVEALGRLPAGSVHVIPYGIGDSIAVQSTRRSAGPVVAGIGRLVPEKGFDVLIRALPSLPGVTAVLVGDGPERLPLEQLAASLGVGGRVVFAGWDTDVRERLGEFDVVVAPSRFEAFGIAIAESMLAGRAVVASRVGGIPEVVAEGETALLVPPDDPAALAAAMRRVLDDPQLRERLGASGRARALERYRPAAAAHAFEALYERVLR